MTREENILKEEYDYDADKGIWSKAKEKFLEGNVHPSGYVRVWLKCIDGKYRTFYYHRAMWYLAYGPIPEGMQVNHIREFEKTNNAISNLNLMTRKENINYGTRTERAAAKQSKAVVAVKDGVVVLEFASAREAGRQGFNSGHVSSCCRGEYYGEGNRFFKGYYWYYKEDWEKINQKS